ncbi:major royal jelly protein 1 [Schistocerca americana]|uniref:major royal jelly protein 1 n=1 Tax=Schistocerca americana TaxID=7009 RepID=UPI001F4FC934|nr:major royal jelly protein 1 [Schistocerca americana]XP_047109301.1 major royal jelly protein 1 [Schistocerca piceifrons]
MTSLSWLLLAAAGLSLVAASCDKSLLPELTFTLNGANLAWPCTSTRNIYASSGRYVSRNIIATRVQIFKDEAIVATPRYKPGVPFTLGKLSLKSKDHQAVLSPFPCWSLQEEGNCQALQSVVDLFLDPQDILWVLDVGIVNTLDQPIRRCPPKIVAINVKTGKVVKVIDLSGLVCSASRLQYLVVDYAEDGRVFIYVSDAATRAIIVFDVTAGRGFRVVLPKAVTDGCLRRDVLYLALIRKPCGTTVLYFTYLSSGRLFSIKTAHLRRGNARGTVVDVGPKPTNLVILGTDGGTALFFRYKGDSEIYLWNTETCFKEENFMLVQQAGECRLATQVVPGYKRLMWVLESNFQDYIQNTVGCAGASVSLHPLVKGCE